MTCIVSHRLGGPRRLPRLIALLLTVALLTVQAALADSKTRDARLGDDFENDVHAGETDTYRIDLVAGTDLSLRARDDERAVVLTLRDPAGQQVASRTAKDARIDVRVSTGGTYRIELQPSGDEVGYRLQIRGNPPSQTGGGTSAPSGGTIHLDVPRGAVVRIEVKRRSGATPEITAVRDGLGRDLGFSVSRRRRSKVRLRYIPVTGPGGLDVDVQGADGAEGTYEVRARIMAADDDDHNSTAADDHERESRRLVLTLAPGADPATVAAALGYELKQVGDGFIVVETPEGREGFEYEDAADADDRSDDVLGAEPDTYVSAPDVPDGSQINGVVLGSDLGRSDVQGQTAIAQIRAAAAQKIATGTGVVVAVLDTGVDALHEALAGHVLPGRDVVDGDDDPSEAKNGLDDDGDGQIDEGYGHGTFVAGLVLAVAPNVQILPVRVLDTDGRGTVSNIAAGIEWAVNNGADVVNLSLGMDASSGILGDAVRYALTRNVVVVAATGNQGTSAAVNFPASISGVVAVTATDPVGAPATFANSGTGTIVAAPGASVVGPIPGGQYGTWSGTSFSAALASGGAALLVQTQPAITPAQVVTRVQRTARRRARLPLRLRRRLGAGRIDLRRLLR